MRLLKYIFFLLIFISCKHGSKQTVTSFKTLNYIKIQEVIQESQTKCLQDSCDLKSIQRQFFAYKDYGIVSIPIAEKIIRHCITSLNVSDKEAVYRLFISLIDKAVNEFNDSFEENYASLIEKLNSDVNDIEVRDFKKCLNLCGLSLLNSEGMYYVDAKYNYVYNLFKKEASPALREFLAIRSEELRQGFSDDAALLISFEDLYLRVISWEDFMKKYPDFFLKDHAKNYYEGYLSTLLSGMDNSRVFDYEDDKLLPEIKALYERIIAKNEDRKSTKIITAYYEYLKTIDFKYNESIEKYLKDNELFNMLGVQPDTR